MKQFSIISLTPSHMGPGVRDRSCSGLKCQMSSLNWEEVEALNLFVQRMASVISRLKQGAAVPKILQLC